MSSFQNVIKIFAICLAIFIIVNIFGAIIFGTTLFIGLFSKRENNKVEVADFSETYKDIRNIDIDLIASKLIIKTGDEFKVEGENLDGSFSSKIVNNTLKIKENKEWFWGRTSAGNIVLYIPENADLKELDLDTGAGTVEVEGVNAKKLDLDHGAGTLEISNSTFNKADINGGAGRINIENSRINDLELDAGVGRVDIEAELTGRSNLECGVGEMNVKLMGNREDYKIRAEKGIGSFKIDGEDASSGNTYGNGANAIDIDGGIGSINVKFSE